MKKLFITAAITAAALIIFFMSQSHQENSETSSPIDLPLIAITKIASHPSLDKIEQGVMDEFKAQNIRVQFQLDNAQGNMIVATQIAQKIVGLNPQLIIPITTPSTQTVYNEAYKKNIPVIFAAVSDPFSTKLVDPQTQKGRGITGVSDIPPIEQQIQLIRKLQPSLRTLGTIYNPSEANSVSFLEKTKKIAEKNGITLIGSPCVNTKEVITATQYLLDKVEAIFISNDNTVVSALDGLIQTVQNNKTQNTTSKKSIPIYASDPESVQRGCLAALALSQYEIGRAVGRLAIQVLKGANPSDLPVVVPSQVELAINKPLAAKLGINIPTNLE